MRSAWTLRSCTAIAVAGLTFPVVAEEAEIQLQSDVDCTAKVLQETFCLGGSLSDLDDARTGVLVDIVTTAKETDGIAGADLYMYESKYDDIRIVTHAVVYDGVLVKVVRLWKVPMSQYQALERELTFKYHSINLGTPTSIGMRPTDGRYDNGITSEIVWQQGGYSIGLLQGGNLGVVFKLSSEF